jgi:hypothetical protein
MKRMVRLIVVILFSLVAFGLVIAQTQPNQKKAATFQKPKSETPELGKSYAALRTEQRRLVDDFVRRYNATTGSSLIPEQAYDNARLSIRTTFDAKRPPNWDRWKGDLIPGGVGNLAAIELSRNKSNASPWKLFVPERVVTFTAPEEVSSFDKSKLDWLIWNSWMALAGMSVVVVPTVSSLTSTPSTSMRAVRP